VLGEHIPKISKEGYNFRGCTSPHLQSAQIKLKFGVKMSTVYSSMPKFHIDPHMLPLQGEKLNINL